MKVHHYDGQSLSLSIDLNPSLNDKLTAWGGSLYGLTVMICWGMFYLKCRERNINPNWVVSHGEIDYLVPVDEALIVSAGDGSTLDWDEVFDKMSVKGEQQ
ncbi:MAG: thioesterase domain-containing protein [Pseudohongiellaceae bacterium]|jgi:thioesterase domain-containing protein